MMDILNETSWTQREAIELARKIRDFAPECGFHVALTGGCLYKDGHRKDADLLFYRIRQEPEANYERMLGLLLKVFAPDLEIIHNYGFVTKATYKGKPVDLLFPEAPYSSSSYKEYK